MNHWLNYWFSLAKIEWSIFEILTNHYFITIITSQKDLIKIIFYIIFIWNILLILLNKNNLLKQKTEDLYGVHPSNDPESYKDQAAFAAHMAHYQNPALYQAFMNTYHRFSLKSWQNLSCHSILGVATVCLDHSRLLRVSKFSMHPG